MNSNFLAAGLASALLILAPSAFAATSYSVEVEAHSASNLHRVPTFVIEDGKTANLASNDKGGYDLSFTVSGAGPGNVKVAASLSTDQGELAPVMIVPIGKPVSVSVGRVQLKFTVTAAGG